MRVTFTVNGRPQQADDVWEGESLLYVLRERLGLPGSKNACEQGECGSCTVRLDGVPVCACLVAAGQAEGREVVTVEGLAQYADARSRRTTQDTTATQDTTDTTDATTAADTTTATDATTATDTTAAATRQPPPLAPVQQAFIDTGAIQCGFCTPGLLIAADELLERTPDPSDADIREALSGNLCRCTGYEKILDAVRLAAARTTEAR
ncbi:putative oxidoreductase [Streptomyces bingchenggensis BCW-1]|uniref:Putative oxidoreductase n=1 Tax=Streptomyces bingchenggensis (strain BCW-1) TaxID=749414 RepID=D7C4P5_STRBB|nr:MULTISPECIES: (2Fe-2S)-binding protein [Streptomyces]ADI06096.1 putative oxidoreductase [Streptomyces bingchenggensis BCW-1]